ncbi:methyltransferase [Pseudomonas huanghezhanensis]|uniref:methyltransferase n=1 Tax=Pseudomonas huanghezhanensis TaxID=3002903 RepID=UPI002286B381|nr:methyltransferase [Pseudomonas sp. BSw22131]
MNTDPILRTHDLRARFEALDRYLLDHQTLWRPKPFTHLQLPWESLHPELAAWLRSRTLDEAEAAHNHPERLDAPAPFVQIARQSSALSALGNLPVTDLPSVSSRMAVDVPGRKWQQIEAFASALVFKQTPEHWLDWCAGKGHLGRRLAYNGQTLTCLEFNPQLVEAGRTLSARLHICAEHIEQDVMAPDASSQLRARHTPVALHACGDLHVQLMRLASDADCQQMAIAPCCYNRITADSYQAMSTQGQASALRLSIDDLGLPLSETVTAGARVRRQRDVSMARRLAFDVLQRELRGTDQYLPTPSLPVAWLEKPFAEYIQDLAAMKDVALTGERNWQSLEALGWQRLAAVRNLELVRNLFRRPLELWLVLDRALYLCERGYNVRIGTFCDSPTTPRNVMILAERI